MPVFFDTRRFTLVTPSARFHENDKPGPSFTTPPESPPNRPHLVHTFTRFKTRHLAIDGKFGLVAMLVAKTCRTQSGPTQIKEETSVKAVSKIFVWIVRQVVSATLLIKAYIRGYVQGYKSLKD